MMFICKNSPWCDRERLQRLQILGRGLAVLARDQLVSDLLAFVQGGQSGLLHRRDMHEHVLRTIVCLNETKTLRCVEPLHFSGWHKNSPDVRNWIESPPGPALRPGATEASLVQFAAAARVSAVILARCKRNPGAPRRNTRSRRNVMKRLLFGLMLLASPVSAQDSVPQIPFDGTDPLKLPKDLYLGEVTGVAVNSKGHVFVLSRGNTTGPAYSAAAAQLLEFDPEGNFVREIGKNLYAWSFGHTVRVDPNDNIWVTDKGSDMVVKFNPRGRVSMVFGRKLEASDRETAALERPNPPLPHEDGRFRQVTDVAFDPAGNAFISDGYITSRPATVDRNGKWLKSWGSKGAKPGEFNTPHSIAADAKGNIYVADRGNRRIQVFDGEGTFQREFTIDVPYDAKAARPAIGNLPDLAKIEAGGGPKTQ